MFTTPEEKKIYQKIQKQLFYIVPEKWEKIYLYASVLKKMQGIETGEMFFYYFPKGILKKNPINVYEIPTKFNLNEEEYNKLVEDLYKNIKELRKQFEKTGKKLWSNLTIKIENHRFTVEYRYNDLLTSNYSSTERHILWKYKYLNLPLESFNRKDRNLILDFLENSKLEDEELKEYEEGIYKRPIKNVLGYNKEWKEHPQEIKNKENPKINKQPEQKYTYKIKKRKEIKKKYNQTDETYIEQIEKQKNAVKSQILNQSINKF